MTTHATYSAFIQALPRIDVPLEGVRGLLSQGVGHQVVFFEIEAGLEIPLHAHGEQWGIVVEGEMELTIGTDTRRYGPGDSYRIPAGTPHGARFLTDFRAIDAFAEPDRYTAARG